jgi:hypothetical protein
MTDIAHACGMSDTPGFQRIEMTISTCAITVGSHRCYRILALCEAYDRNGAVVQFRGVNGGLGFMSIKVVHDWCRHVSDFRGIEESDNMSWNDLVVVLRDVSKVNYSRYGEVRRVEDKLRLTSEWVRPRCVDKSCIGPKGWQMFLERSREWRRAEVS